jgi:glycyl-tRNA synthetase alpha chain
MNKKTLTFADIILTLQNYWANHPKYPCVLAQPTDVEVGAGTFNPNTFLRALGPEPWRVAYVEPSRRPTDGRYGENPNRMQFYYQFQVIVKPAPEDSQNIYLDSLRALGIDVKSHDVRFVEDDWESPTLGATGLGWEVWLDGMEVSQYTYFQQVGGLPCDPVSLELTYGLERLGMFIQGVDSVYDLVWAPGVSYGEMHNKTELQWSTYNFEKSNSELLFRHFDDFENEAKRLIAVTDKAGHPLVYPAYDFVMKCSHTFNTLQATGMISVAQRQDYILRIRRLANMVAKAYVEMREAMGFPLLKKSITAGADAKPSATGK